ncbi:carboxyl-terminal processing protease [Nitrospirillum amazonense]|uniref:Carboxyl-terminal processing protease n=1 Tax=Nitrospirillum amazonense TaxID=28077 RepID=A0A560F0A1_9PROT|nr:S41 family peptidase [Nitrospirillum amazonense]TWB15053.1 carboxyl-terminal processing protease [Nitrospirillum amazonense]
MKKLLTSVAVVALVYLASPLSRPLDAKPPIKAETYKQLELFTEAFERVKSDYVEEVPDDQLVEAAINGMLASLDPHSNFMNKKNWEDMQVQTKGEFGGLGLEVTEENGVVKVISPIDDTPASRAGVQPGDYITHLNDEAIVGLGLNEAVEKMRGAPGTDIKVTIHRNNVPQPLTFTLTRAVIKVQSVRWRVEGNVGYIRLSGFTEQTQVGLDKALAGIQKELGDKVVGYVLDLRNNPGGLLDQAISVSDTFLERGEIVSTRGRRPDQGERYNAKPGDAIHGLPLVVLINGGSASASEIVAGALQDHKRAILMGTQSFGKGSVQTLMPMPGGNAMKLTTARYYTPSGRSIQQLGITPDIEVQQAKVEELGAPAGAIRRREADLPHALRNTDPGAKQPAKPDDAKDKTSEKAPDAKAPDGKTPDNKGVGADKAKVDSKTQDPKAGTKGQDAPGTPVPPAATGDATPQDYQLTRALDLLRGLSLLQQSKATN